ncbi:MetQ/NlpA family ABC transporter substrate-binding protein [Streptomyces nojiriensis]|uniref:MetQ/NlpA family ABC transporter substrate-binding protein n=1 Tax=Streptomyces nojiriensis TaxID=66374 RepID=UPI00364A131B
MRAEPSRRDSAPPRPFVRVGVSGDSPEWDVLAQEAEKEGLTVETVVFDDCSLPDKALGAGDIELNAFQHLVFLAQSNTENKTDVAARAGQKDNADYQKIIKLYASQVVQDEVRRTSNGTAHHIELPAADLQAEVARIQKQLKR